MLILREVFPMSIVLCLMLLCGAGFSLLGWLFLRRERAKLRAESDEKLKVRTSLVRAAAHELRQPLNSIVGLVSSMRSASGAPGKNELDGKLDQSVKDLNLALINILEIFDLSYGNITLTNEPINLSDETKILIRKYNKKLAEEDSKVKVIAGTLRECWVEVDVLRYRQCLETLIEQAIYQTHAGAVQVSYQAERNDGGMLDIRVTVKDEGRGMDQHRANRFFDPSAYDQNPALKGRPAAMLAINLAAQMAELLGGGIDAQSTIGNNTRFVFTLTAEGCPPVAPEDLTSITTDPSLPSFKELSVLLVDDNDVNLFVLEEFISPLEFGQIVSVNNGQEAVERAAEECFDLVLLDLAMPGLDGFQVAQMIRAEGLTKKAPIVAVSAEHIRSDDPRFIESSMDGFVRKPVDSADLFAAILKVAPRMLDAAKERGVSSEEKSGDKLRLVS